MSPRRRRSIIAEWLSLGVLLAVAAAFASSRVRSSITERLPKADDPFQTVMTGKIQPASEFSLMTEYAARVVDVRVAPGAQVAAGDVIVVLENGEISSQVVAAEKRVAIATARLEEARAGGSNRAERRNAAARARDAARERLEAFSVDPANAALETAQARTAQIRTLIRQGLATSAELESARAAEAAAQRESVAAKEHYSRLRQELADAESATRLNDALSSAGSTSNSLQADLEDARNALAVATERAGRLRILAPAAGTVVALSLHAGDTVLAGSVVARVSDLAQLSISMAVTPEVARKTPRGTKVVVRFPTEPPQRVEAVVESVSLVPDPGQHGYVVRIVTPNPARGLILAGLEAQIEFRHTKVL